MIKVYHAYAGIINEHNRHRIIGLLSPKGKQKLSGFKREEDKLLLLTSSVLLSKALEENGYSGYRLSDMQFTPEGRPYFANTPFDFNISHTDFCAALVFSDNCRVGIDIEKIKSVDISDFETIFPPDSWDIILSSENKDGMFYYFWTLVESAVKADGRGLPLISSPSAIKILKDRVVLNGKEWFFYHKNFDPSISCSITSDKASEEIQFIAVNSW